MENTEKQEMLSKLRRKIDIANKVRLAFMFIAVVLLVVIYFGNKFYAGVAWYDRFVAKSYAFLTYDILFMLVAILIKIGMTVKYNHYVKKR